MVMDTDMRMDTNMGMDPGKGTNRVPPADAPVVHPVVADRAVIPMMMMVAVVGTLAFADRCGIWPTNLI